MPNIREYNSPIDKLSPDEKGYQAHEMAGRRVGPLYTQMASDIKEGGKLQAQIIEQAGKGLGDQLTQADKLNTDALDYLGALKTAKAAAVHNGGVSFVGGGSGGREAGLSSQLASSAADLSRAALGYGPSLPDRSRGSAGLADWQAKQVTTPGETPTGEWPGGAGGGPNSKQNLDYGYNDPTQFGTTPGEWNSNTNIAPGYNMGNAGSYDTGAPGSDTGPPLPVGYFGPNDWASWAQNNLPAPVVSALGGVSQAASAVAYGGMAQFDPMLSAQGAQ